MLLLTSFISSCNWCVDKNSIGVRSYDLTGHSIDLWHVALASFCNGRPSEWRQLLLYFQKVTTYYPTYPELTPHNRGCCLSSTVNRWFSLLQILMFIDSPLVSEDPLRKSMSAFLDVFPWSAFIFRSLQGLYAVTLVINSVFGFVDEATFWDLRDISTHDSKAFSWHLQRNSWSQISERYAQFTKGCSGTFIVL